MNIKAELPPGLPSRLGAPQPGGLLQRLLQPGKKASVALSITSVLSVTDLVQSAQIRLETSVFCTRAAGAGGYISLQHFVETKGIVGFDTRRPIQRVIRRVTVPLETMQATSLLIPPRQW